MKTLFSKRFADDYRLLQPDGASQARKAVRLVEQEGPYYPSLQTRRIKGNRDRRYRYMDISRSLRMVVCAEGDVVLFEKVGDHDPTLAWGETATTETLDKVIAEGRHTSSLPQHYGERSAPSATLAEVAESISLLTDLVTDRPPDFLDGYRDGTIEDWMVFLSPLQTDIVKRDAKGPSRVTGGPGTGKTVVALHRTAEIHRLLGDGASILVTSQIRTLAPILQNLFERLAPETSGVEFTHIQDIARDVVRRHEGRIGVDEDRARKKFDAVWERESSGTFRISLDSLDPDYVWEEIRRVIRGRDVYSEQKYLEIARHGRRRPLTAQQRSAVWRVSDRYKASCELADPPVFDGDSLIQKAYHLLRGAKLPVAWDAVIIDEAQDLTEVGLRILLMQLAGGHLGRLLLVGDGGQRIYAGGYRLLDVGVETRGRSFILRDAYRSTRGILDAVSKVGQLISAEDFGEEGLGSTEVRAVRDGAPPEVMGYAAGDDERIAILSLIDHMTPEQRAATALLVPTNRAAKEWAQELRTQQIGVTRLDEYEGIPTAGVKVGTYSRSKGLEFGTVILPSVSDGVVPPVSLEDDSDTYFQKSAELYVAMARARDRLSISYVGEPSYLLTDLLASDQMTPHA